jgi:hypothetical protein
VGRRGGGWKGMWIDESRKRIDVRESREGFVAFRRRRM